MKKRTLMSFIFITLIVAVFAVITANSQENVKGVQDSAFKELMRPTVRFMHDEHNEKAEIEDCSACHHTFKDGKLVEDETSEDSECSECHQSENGKNPIVLITAYHANCKGCHVEKETGPIMCAECHTK